MALLFIATLLLGRVSGKEIEEYVNVLGGTDSKIDFSHGNALPLFARPWGFDSWSVQSNQNEVDGWWFHPKDRRFMGIRNTHQPSPWINDYGQFLVTASMPGLQHSSESVYWSGYNPNKATWSPYYFKTTLLAYGTSAGQSILEFAPGRHSGIMRVTFPPVSQGYENSGFDQTRRISVVLNKGNDTSSIKVIDGTTFITGFSTKNSGGVPEGEVFKHFFVAAIYFGKDGNDNSVSIKESYADSTWAWVNIPAQDDGLTDTITVRMATSLISEEQAMTNLQQEVGLSMSFDDIVDQGRKEWHAQLSRFTVTEVGAGYTPQEQEDLKTVFYSTQYRASLFPRQLTELTSSGQLVHWSPYDPKGGVYSGPLSSDSGFWDAYSTVYPLHSIVNRNRLGSEMIQGWLNAYKEGGWLPKWSSPGYREGMVGTMADITLSDAIVNNIPGFDVQLAYQAIRKDAFEIPPEGVEGVGRVCLEGYLKHGAIPSNGPMTTGGTCYETVSRTLNYLQSDWAVAQAAAKLAQTSDENTLMARAANFSILFESKSGLFQPRKEESLPNGAKELVFSPTFDQFAWGGDYTEGGPWQYRFYVPYDPQGLATMYKQSGRDVCELLAKAQTAESTYHVGAYSVEIHEQTEMPENCWGQYAHNNQPVHHMLYMFAAVDPTSSLTGACASQGQMYLRRAMTSLYKAGFDMYAGDEDNGQMSAWFLLSSMGLYSLAPGSGNYNIGSPLFSRVEVTIDHGKTLVIEAKNNGPSNVYVHAVYFNGERLTEGKIPYSKLIQGGLLSFDMADKPFEVR